MACPNCKSTQKIHKMDRLHECKKCGQHYYCDPSIEEEVEQGETQAPVIVPSDESIQSYFEQNPDMLEAMLEKMRQSVSKQAETVLVEETQATETPEPTKKTYNFQKKKGDK